MTASKERLHARISGHVQGVNFRYYTRQTAQEIGVTGWVRNRVDGTVEVLAEGSRAELEALLRFLSVGPSSARVSEVQTNWLSATGEYADFQISQ